MLHLSTSILLQTFLVPILIIYADKPLIVENGAVCENKATGFFVVDNKILGTANSIVYKDTPEEDCITTCSTNRDRFGRSILCASFVYDHVSFTCTIFKEKAKPEGNADVVHVVGKRYFEKICLEEEVPKECADSQFIRADDFVLIGFARNVTLVETMEQCVAQCVKEKDCKVYNFFPRVLFLLFFLFMQCINRELELNEAFLRHNLSYIYSDTLFMFLMLFL
ncbi:PAN domain protein [Dictyocaulus viviparus]|uniref:PAN domain protein n=1 Tax=Dictyocaulus viviparus TaxID=29172 RepID=A0A0D8XCM5_DICVI|nr:PAN domain protein [Dictyocaulus viviparus]